MTGADRCPRGRRESRERTTKSKRWRNEGVKSRGIVDRPHNRVVVRPSPQLLVIGGVLLLGGGCLVWLSARSAGRPLDAGFWFETVKYESSALGGALTAEDLETISATARSEVARAFAAWPVEISDRRDATYQVRVVEGLTDPMFKSDIEIAGQSRAVSGFGGQGAVSFRLIAGHAIGYAPPGVGRAAIITAIGRGIGRSVVHEFAHQFLPTAQIHGSDRQSYEFGSASRPEQYYGDLHWDIAGPLLKERLGR